MSRFLLLRSRALPFLSRAAGRPSTFSTASASPSPSSASSTADPIAAAAADQPPPPPPPPPSSASPTVASRRSRGFLAFGSLALAGALGTTAYATYAYTLDEVEQKADNLRKKSNYTLGDDASGLEVDTQYEQPNDKIPSPNKLNIDGLFIGDLVSYHAGMNVKPLWVERPKENKVLLNRELDALEGQSRSPPQRDLAKRKKFQALVYTTAMKIPAKSVELYLDLRRTIEEQVRGFTEPSAEKLLPDLHPQEQHVFTLVLDLNETLVYSDWKRDRGWRTFKRPGVDAFLEHLAKFYEIVVYSDQLNMYVDPVIERLDRKGCIRYRLSRAATRYQNGKHYRDLSKLNRDPSRILYVSGHAVETSLQPENCVPIKPWKLENDDTALLDLIPFLEYVALHRPADIRPVLASYQGRDIASEFIERSKEHQRRMQDQKQHNRFWRR